MALSSNTARLLHERGRQKTLSRCLADCCTSEVVGKLRSAVNTANEFLPNPIVVPGLFPVHRKHQHYTKV